MKGGRGNAARSVLPLAEGLICATKLWPGASHWTQDEQFKDFPAVKYLPMKWGRSKGGRGDS